MQKRAMQRPATPSPASRATAAEDGPPLTPQTMARSEFGRAYWSARQQAELMAQQGAAAERMVGQRRSWQAAQRARLEASSDEWWRRKTLARTMARLAHAAAE